MLLHVVRRVPKDEEPIAQYLGHDALVGFDDARHDREVAGEEEEQVLMGETLGDRREVPDVREHDRDVPAGHMQPSCSGVPPQDVLDDGLRQVALEDAHAAHEVRGGNLDLAHVQDARLAIGPVRPVGGPPTCRPVALLHEHQDVPQRPRDPQAQEETQGEAGSSGRAEDGEAGDAHLPDFPRPRRPEHLEGNEHAPAGRQGGEGHHEHDQRRQADAEGARGRASRGTALGREGFEARGVGVRLQFLEEFDPPLHAGHDAPLRIKGRSTAQ
mmetsp:Transcript_54524/g.169280  ORF Transcript_54524/g.169280 Transcript_54524/m.169280 type:complete len:271 (+) Transcript_54524:329-1141(+)